ncbi:YjcZ family sporulation protein [Sporosarcina sp. NPDC096371]
MGRECCEGSGNSFSLIVVLFILLIIIGASFIC